MNVHVNTKNALSLFADIFTEMLYPVPPISQRNIKGRRWNCRHCGKGGRDDPKSRAQLFWLVVR